MSKEEINVAIAEACGWRQSEVEIMTMHFPGEMLPSKVKRWFRGDWSKLLSQGVEGVPDYCNDLNAMHEAEKILTKDQKLIFCNYLTLQMIWNDEDGFAWFGTHATATQRAEAFLKTLGK